MPVPYHAPAVAAPTLHAAIGILRARGIRLSRPARRLLECLYAPGAPRTAEQLAAAGAGDVATVYRNLGALEEAGVVRHSHRAGGAACWAPAAAVPGDGRVRVVRPPRAARPRAVAQLRAVARRAARLRGPPRPPPAPRACARTAPASARRS